MPDRQFDPMARPGRYLVEALGNKYYRFYEPISEKPVLFMEFARLGGSEEEIVGFANQYGRLGVGKALDDHQLGENLPMWRNSIVTMACAVKIFEHLKDDDETALSDHIVWSENGQSVFFHMTDSMTDGLTQDMIQELRKVAFELDHNKPIGMLESFVPGDVFQPAKLWLLKLVNKSLRGEASPCLYFDDNGQMGPYVSPHNLRACLWLQLYRALTERDFRRCAICHGWMDTTNQRSDKKRHDTCYEREKKRKQANKAVKKTKISTRSLPEQTHKQGKHKA